MGRGGHTILRCSFLFLSLPLRLSLSLTPRQLLPSTSYRTSRPSKLPRTCSRRRRTTTSKRTSRTRKHRWLRHTPTSAGLFIVVRVSAADGDSSGTPSVTEFLRLRKGNGCVRRADGCDSVVRWSGFERFGGS